MPPSFRAWFAVAISPLIAACASAAGSGPASDPGPGGATWKVGVARAVVTPKTGVWLAGYGTKRAPTGTLHDLWMKALGLEDAAVAPRRRQTAKTPLGAVAVRRHCRVVQEGK